MNADVDLVLRCYPKIYFACHVRHVRDETWNRRVSAHQASVLDHLDELAPTPLADLGRHIGVTASTMSLTVDRLVRDGYVSRKRSAEDARRLDLKLTSAGATIKRQKKVLDPCLVELALNRLDERKRRQALRGLEIFAGACVSMVQSGALRGVA